MKRVTVLGGTGVFGSRIAADLAADSGTCVRIVSRDRAQGTALAAGLGAEFLRADLADPAELKHAVDQSTIVIHAAGPFQVRDYRVAEACIDAGSHYLDLADARGFVTGITALHERARSQGVFVTSGASSVPAITFALIDDLRSEFAKIDHIQIALSPGNQNPRGASTIAAILTYLGRPIRIWQDDQWITRRGWGDAVRLQFPPPVGDRRVHNCDVPDLELFPGLFEASTIRFHAGVELAVINHTLSAIAAMRRIVPMPWLHKAAALFLRGSLMLRRFGTRNGSLAVWVRGLGLDQSPRQQRIAIVTDNDGPATPCSASIILARKILANGPPTLGAHPCVGFITASEVQAHLQKLGVWIARGDEHGWRAMNEP